jgi:hypothetical protein
MSRPSASADPSLVVLADFQPLSSPDACGPFMVHMRPAVLVFDDLLLGTFFYDGSCAFSGGKDNSEARMINGAI